MRIRPARAEEAGLLGELALRSKAHWGYDEAFLERCRPVLALRPAEVGARRTTVADRAGRVAGFYTLDGEPPAGELGNLWIDPGHLRRGVGRRLWSHAVEAARGLGFRHLVIAADPHAEGFYLAMGAVRTGEIRSEVEPGRLLPELRFPL
jgi:N-acetylglutamate synthase-like GNAT family acetyltransferase